MSNNFKEHLNSNKYFKSLSPITQEAIKQSNIEIESEEDLRRLAENLMKND